MHQPITAPALEQLSEVASRRLVDHQHRFRKDYNASRESVAFLSKVVENDDTAPIELLINVSSARKNVKTQATQDLVRIRDENAELILAAQQNADKFNETNGSSQHADFGKYSDQPSATPSPSSLCESWRRSVYHFNMLALMAAQETAQLHRREQQLLRGRELAKRAAQVMDENRALVSECAALENELATLEREGEWLDVRMPRWSTEESFLESLPQGEVEWKKLFFMMQRFIKETKVPNRELDAVADILDAVYQLTSSQVKSKLPQ